MLLIAPHFPKAGGSSLQETLCSAYQDGLMLDYGDDPALPESRRQIDPDGYWRRTPVIPPNVSCIYGHFNPRKYVGIGSTAWFTMLRHPVSNLVSIYYYWKAVEIGGTLHRYVIENQLSLLDTNPR